MTRACRDCNSAILPRIRDEDREPGIGWIGKGIPALKCMKRAKVYPKGATHDSGQPKYMINPDNVCDHWEPWRSNQ